jgi:hypothetical protein
MLVNGLEAARDALRVELAGQHRLVPRRRHERHRREVVELVRSHRVYGLDERQLIEQVRLQEGHLAEQVLDAPHIRCAQTAHDPEDLVTLAEQQFGKIRAVLPGDAGNECSLGHV